MTHTTNGSLRRHATNAIHYVTAGFCYAIIDSTPILAVLDATNIGEMLGATMMVLK